MAEEHEQTARDYFQRSVHGLTDRLSVFLYTLRSEMTPNDASSIQDHFGPLEEVSNGLSQFADAIDNASFADESLKNYAHETRLVVHSLLNSLIHAKHLIGSSKAGPAKALTVLQNTEETIRNALQGLKALKTPDVSGPISPAPSATPCGDAEFVLEIEIPDDVSDDELFADVGLVSNAIDDLHRSLGGHGVKISRLEIYDESRVPEVQHG